MEDTFWTRANFLMKSRGETVKSLSSKCSVDAEEMSRWMESGDTPDALSAVHIAAALGTSVEFLVKGEPPRFE